jgi:hypothetical protein
MFCQHEGHWRRPGYLWYEQCPEAFRNPYSRRYPPTEPRGQVLHIQRSVVHIWARRHDVLDEILSDSSQSLQANVSESEPRPLPVVSDHSVLSGRGAGRVVK